MCPSFLWNIYKEDELRQQRKGPQGIQEMGQGGNGKSIQNSSLISLPINFIQKL